MENAAYYMEKAMEFIWAYGPKVVGAILLFIIGSWVIKWINRILARAMSKGQYEESLKRFIVDLASWALKVLLVILVISTLGIDVTTFAAILAAAGLAIGLALQGSLANFAGGVLIMIFKPYRIGDLIEAQGELGVVKEIEIFTTKLNTPENKLAIIPNGPLANGNIINYTAEGKIRVDTVIGVAYEEDIRAAKDVLAEVINSNPKVLKDPAPTVNVLELGDSSVNFAVRPFCKPEDYWDVYFATTEGCKLALDKAGIEIPYPHRVQIQKA